MNPDVWGEEVTNGGDSQTVEKNELYKKNWEITKQKL